MSDFDCHRIALSVNPLTGRQLPMLSACTFSETRRGEVSPVCDSSTGPAKPTHFLACMRCTHPDDFCSDAAPTVTRRSSEAARTRYATRLRRCSEGEAND